MNTPKTMAADVSWSNDSDASNDTGGFSIGFSLNVLQVFHLIIHFCVSASCYLESCDFFTDILPYDCRVNVSNLYVRSYEQLLKLLLQMLLYKQLDLPAKTLLKTRGKDMPYSFIFVHLQIVRVLSIIFFAFYFWVLYQQHSLHDFY